MTQETEQLDGSLWKVNDSGRKFVVVNTDSQYVYVENVDPPARRRRILRSALRTSKAKTGYTLISLADGLWAAG